MTMNPRVRAISFALLAWPLASFGTSAHLEVELSRQEGDSTSSAKDVWTQEELEAVTAEIQVQVEELRGEKFKRPVAVQVTDKAGLIKFAIGRMEEMVSADQLAAEDLALKMLGLIPPSMNVLEVTLKMLEEQVGGFYDPKTESFYLMDSYTGGVAKVILAHELTHALDDQLFDIDGALESRLQSRDASAAYMAVVEGSGTSVMSSWTMKNMGSLSVADLQAAGSMGTESLAETPPALWKPMLSSYTQGSAFLSKGFRLLKKQGKSMADVTRMAFENPPVSTEQILHPEKYWDESKRDDPKELPLPIEVPEGWTRLDSSTLGELHFALMCEEPKEIDFSNPMSVMSLAYTNEAAKGWGADRVELFAKDDARVLLATTVWDTAEDAAEFVKALEGRVEAWRASMSELDKASLGSGVAIDLMEGDSHEVRFRSWFGAAAEHFGR